MAYNMGLLVSFVILITTIPKLAETVYTPSLPNIVHDLNISATIAEYSFTIYLLGFAIGILVWGRLSDKIGRKACVLLSLLIFIIGCVRCYYADTINILMVGIFIQSFGASTGNVLAQTICRDVFHGVKLSKAYSLITSSLAVSASIGAIIGGVIAQYFTWHTVFLFLMIFASITAITLIIFLPETLHPTKRKNVSFLKIGTLMIQDKKLIGFLLIVALCNGIYFSYFAEGAFYLIDLLGLSPTIYGGSFVAIAISVMVGGIISKYLNNYHNSINIMIYGIFIIFISSAFFCSLVIISTYFYQISNFIMIWITILSQMGIMFGFAFVVSNALALCLQDYKNCLGTASSLFGFFYYFLAALVTLGMGTLNNGTFLPMPLYFLGISLSLFLILKIFINDTK